MSVTALPPAGGSGSPSTKPYLIRALHDWCTDNGFTPYLAVFVDATVQVPLEYVKNSEIVLNVGFEATGQLNLGNEFIDFKARFGGVVRDIVVPVDHVLAIYARENGQGMAFPAPNAEGGGEAVGTPMGADSGSRQAPGLRLATEDGAASSAKPGPAEAPDDEPPRPPSGPRPALKRVK